MAGDDKTYKVPDSQEDAQKEFAEAIKTSDACFALCGRLDHQQKKNIVTAVFFGEQEDVINMLCKAFEQSEQLLDIAVEATKRSIIKKMSE